jgi:retron-type reverse transcriptase
LFILQKLSFVGMLPNVDNMGRLAFQSGVDGMNVNELEEYLHEHRATLTEQIRSRNYHAQAIRGREIPKGGGKMRLLGIPTAID